MKVYLIKTPEYAAEDFTEVAALLSSFDGPLEFIPSLYEFDKSEFYFLRYHLYPHHNFKYPSNDTTIPLDPGRDKPLSWRELFSLCNFYREVFYIENDGFVVLLTQRKNALNWFSAQDGSQNIFVHTAEWEHYTSVNAKYPIAYQVAENIMQSLMNINIDEIPNPYAHLPLRGCMNDFCDDKRQIIVKLQTANICEACLERIKQEKVDVNILKQVRDIFNGIRNEFIFKIEKPPLKPSSMIIDSNGKIHLPDYNLEIQLTPLFKTLYLFLLGKPEGVCLAQLSDFNHELMAIYRKLRPSACEIKAASSIQNLSHPLGDGFNPTKTHINKIITSLLNEPMADYYRISGSAGNPYYISVPRNLIDYRF